MRQPSSHDRAHPMWPDKWDPYKKRQYIGHLLANPVFEMLIECDSQGRGLHDVDSVGAGCLDAPEEVPAGSTLRVGTLGRWEREHYNRLRREETDWRESARAEIWLAKMLREILVEVENG